MFQGSCRSIGKDVGAIFLLAEGILSLTCVMQLFEFRGN